MTNSDAYWVGYLSSSMADALAALGSGDPARARLALRRALDELVDGGGASSELEGILAELTGDAVIGHVVVELDPPHSAAGGSVRHDSPLNAA